MAKWRKVKLADVCKFVRGPFGGSLKKDIFVSQGYAVFEQQHAIYGDFNMFRYFVTKDKFNEMQRFKLSPGDLIMSCSGTLGKVALVPEGIPHGIINQALLKLTPTGEVEGSYIKSWFESDLFTQSLRQNSGGAAIQNVAEVRLLKEIEIPLPPLAEQRKIAEILRTWDEAIETAEAELKAKQELLKRAVAKYFEKAYRDATSGKVGKLKTLDAVCTRKGEYGAAVSACPYNPEWPRYIRITDITETGILKKERAVSISPESAEGYSLKMGDLLFARTGEPGRCLIFNEAYLAAFAGYLIRFKARPEVTLPEYVYFYTLSSVYDKWVGDVSQKGAQANINAKVYGSLQLPVTDLNSQEAAVRVFKALQESVLLAEQGAELLRTQKRGLMQKLLTGEVRVAA
jgi:type I restriction enzyme S subunit